MRYFSRTFISFLMIAGLLSGVVLVAPPAAAVSTTTWTTTAGVGDGDDDGGLRRGDEGPGNRSPEFLRDERGFAAEQLHQLSERRVLQRPHVRRVSGLGGRGRSHPGPVRDVLRPRDHDLGEPGEDRGWPTHGR